MYKVYGLFYMDKVFHYESVLIDVVNKDVITVLALAHTKMNMNAIECEVVVDVHANI